MVCLLLLFAANPLGAGSRGDDKEAPLAQGILNQVETAARKAKTLEELGKETLSQSAEILDLGEAAQKPLLEALKDRKKDWKLRFWVVDILGYVGDGASEGALLKAARNSKENKLVRGRAKKALREVRERISASKSRPSRPSQ